MHHANDIDDEMRERMEEGAPEALKELERALNDDPPEYVPGPTGRHPDGKLTAMDEGELAFRIGTTNRKVVLDFGTRVTWVGMDAEQAMALARMLIKHARKVE